MASIVTRRIDRMLSTSPMPLKNTAKITLHYGEASECPRRFVRDYVPLMAYGNGHLQFTIQAISSPSQEYCQLTTKSETVVTLNFKIYRYPLQMLQRILDIAAENE